LEGVITDSQNSKQDICRYLQIPFEKITVIPIASACHFRPLPEAQVGPLLDRYGLVRPYILYVGSVEPRKNLLRLLDAYVLLRQSLPQYRLVIVGARNYWKSSPVARAVEHQGLQAQVTFTGYIPDEHLPALYNGAALFCFPSLYEGFGLPVLEAMACGVPVVTSSTSSLPEVAGDAALLVDPYNVDEVADAMRRVLQDGDLAHDLRRRGLARAAQFSWEKTARETIAVYEKVLGRKLL
jgi:glycosyltransferase involved in cell wall biosynthesis